MYKFVNQEWLILKRLEQVIKLSKKKQHKPLKTYQLLNSKKKLNKDQYFTYKINIIQRSIFHLTLKEPKCIKLKKTLNLTLKKLSNQSKYRLNRCQKMSLLTIHKNSSQKRMLKIKRKYKKKRNKKKKSKFLNFRKAEEVVEPVN